MDGVEDDEAAGSVDARRAEEEVMRRRALLLDDTMAMGVVGDGRDSASGGVDGLRWYVGSLDSGCGAKREPGEGRIAAVMTLDFAAALSEEHNYE